MVGVDAVFGFSGTRLRLAAHPFGLAPQSVAQSLLLGGHGLKALGPAPEVVVEITGVEVGVATVELHDPVAHPVEKIAVVGHKEESHPRVGEI